MRWPLPEKPDFEAEGLLSGLEGPAREARIRLLEYLLAEGADLAEIKCEAAADPDRLGRSATTGVGLFADLVFTRPVSAVRSGIGTSLHRWP